MLPPLPPPLPPLLLPPLPPPPPLLLHIMPHMLTITLSTHYCYCIRDGWATSTS